MSELVVELGSLLARGTVRGTSELVASILRSVTRASLPFQVIHPIWWYLGPLNPENGLSGIDSLGLHETAIVNFAPAAVGAASLASVAATLWITKAGVRR